MEAQVAPMSRIFELQGMPDMRLDGERFLRGGGGTTHAVIPAGGDLELPEDLRAIVGEEIPRGLLDIYGKPPVQRQAAVLREAGVSEILFVADVEAERPDLAHIRVVRGRGGGTLPRRRPGWG